MTRDMLRVLGPALASIAAILAATLALDWFIVDFGGARELTKITFDLREARACTTLGPCAVVPMSMIKGSFYPALAAVTFWVGMVFVVLVAIQCGKRILGGEPGESITRISHLLGVILMLTATGAGYVFGPDFEAGAMMGFAVERGFGPMLMLGGLVAGHAALYFARAAPADPPFQQIEPYRPRTPTRDPIIPRATASTRVPLPLDTPPQGQRVVPRAPTAPPPIATSRTKTPGSPGGRAPTTPPPPKGMPELFKGKIRFSLVTGDLSAAGIDARREDGGSVLVLWRDVVGFVVRRLPPELEGHPFVDVVSTAGMTLRVLPWSKLTGENFGEADPEARLRTFLKLVVPRCPEARLDRASRTFVDDTTKRAAQLPSLELLEKHDQALA